MNLNYLTLSGLGGIQFVLELGEHFNGEGLALLPYFYQFSDLFLQGTNKE